MLAGLLVVRQEKFQANCIGRTFSLCGTNSAQLSGGLVENL